MGRVEIRHLVNHGGQYSITSWEGEEGGQEGRLHAKEEEQGEPKTPLKSPKKKRNEKSKKLERKLEDLSVTLQLASSVLGNFLSPPAAEVLERRFAQQSQVSQGIIT